LNLHSKQDWQAAMPPDNDFNNKFILDSNQPATNQYV